MTTNAKTVKVNRIGESLKAIETIVGFRVNRFPEPPINHLSLFSWSGSGESPASLSPPLATRERPSTLMERLLWELSPRIKNEIVLAPLARSLSVQNTHGITERVPRLAVSFFAILSSIRFRTIPLPLRVPLAFTPLEHVRVSCIPY